MIEFIEIEKYDDGSSLVLEKHDNGSRFMSNRKLKPIAEKPKDDFDFNGDGKVDEKDISLAGKLLRRSKKIKKSNKE